MTGLTILIEPWFDTLTPDPPAGPDLETWYTMGLPKARGPQSIQIEGLRMPCVLLQTAGDQDGLVFRSWRQARAAPIS